MDTEESADSDTQGSIPGNICMGLEEPMDVNDPQSYQVEAMETDESQDVEVDMEIDVRTALCQEPNVARIF